MNKQIKQKKKIVLKDVSTESISYQTEKKTVLNDFSPGTTVYQIEGKNCKKMC